MNPKKHFLDINHVPISKDGITNFYWPINANLMHENYIKLQRSVVDYIRQLKASESVGADAIRILYHYFVMEVMSLYEASLLLTESNRQGVLWENTGSNPWVTILKENKSPRNSSFIRRLLSAPAKPSLLRKSVRFVRDFWISKKDGMTRYFLKTCDYEKDIVSLTINPLAVKLAKQSKDKVYFNRDELWFEKPTSLNPSHIYSEIIEGLLACVANQLDHFTQQLKEYFTEWLEVSIPLVDAYLLQLEGKSRIPKRLWVGTTGHLWGRILSRHVRKNGGHVTRFDHGSGCGYFSDSHLQGSYEYEDCDQLVTFSHNQAEAMNAAYQAGELVQQAPPKIVGVDTENIVESKPALSNSREIKKVMYVGSIYPNGYFYPGAKSYMRNHVLLDWEVRLMAKLKDWGYQVIFKPHPTESICLEPPKSIEDLLGPVRVDQLFEEVYGEADLIILDDPTTSLLSTLVGSDKPAIYVDFEVAPFSEKALSLVEKRFACVKGGYDDDNRAVVDWEALRNAIHEAPSRTNKAFFEFYF